MQADRRAGSIASLCLRDVTFWEDEAALLHRAQVWQVRVDLSCNVAGSKLEWHSQGKAQQRPARLHTRSTAGALHSTPVPCRLRWPVAAQALWHIPNISLCQTE